MPSAGAAAPASRPGRRSAAVLTAARFGEQGALGACLLLLALRLPVAEFGLVSLLLSFQAIAVAASDHGLGLAVLAAPPGRPVAGHHLRKVRRRNEVLLVVTLAGCLVGAAVTGEVTGAVAVALCGGVWVASSEAYVRKSAALRLGRAQEVATIEVVGSALLLGSVAIAGYPGRAAVALGVGLLLKSLVEALRFPRVVAATFAPDGDDVTPGWVWGSQLLAYATANVDYALVGLLLGSRALGLYGLAFRAASLLPAQLNAVLVRLGTVDLASRSAEERSVVIAPLVRRLLLAGAAFGIAGALAAPLVGPVLGERWADAAPLMVPLFLVAPWRVLLPVVGMTALVDRRADALCRAEGVRLLVTVVALLAGAAIGVAGVATLGSLALVAATTVLLVRSPLAPPGAPARLLVAAAGLGSVVVLAAGAL